MNHNKPLVPPASAADLAATTTETSPSEPTKYEAPEGLVLRRTQGSGTVPTDDVIDLAKTTAADALRAAADRVHEEDGCSVLIAVHKPRNPGEDHAGDGYSGLSPRGDVVDLALIVFQAGQAVREALELNPPESPLPGVLNGLLSTFGSGLGLKTLVIPNSALVPGPGKDSTPPADSPYFGRRMGSA